MTFRSVAPALVLVLGACAGGGPPAPPGLSVGVPSPADVTYITGDTLQVDMDAGGQPMQARITSAATLGTAFRREGDGVQMTLQVRDYRAQQANPMGTASADGSGISGPMVVTFDRRGVATVVSLPEVSGQAVDFFQPLELAHGLLPRLPGRAVGMGETWTDTIRFEGAQGPGSVSTSAVMTYTVAGDTMVDGRSLLRVGVEGTSRSDASGSTMGMDFTQAISGSLTGWFLWDLNRSLLVESFTEADARGTMNVAAAPFPLPMRVRARGWVRLQGGS